MHQTKRCRYVVVQLIDAMCKNPLCSLSVYHHLVAAQTYTRYATHEGEGECTVRLSAVSEGQDA